MKNHLTLKVKPKEIRSEIYFDQDLSDHSFFLKRCLKFSKRFAIIADENVADLYSLRLFEYLKDQGIDVSHHIFKPGEKSKNRKVKHELEDALFKAGHRKDSCLIAVGGGVTTDLVGFIAATFCRGIPYLSIPTTLMGMVDASIGGKTGVNTSYGKNLIGSFHFPSVIFIDLSVIVTLTEEKILEGTAEILKYGLIQNVEIFHKIQNNLDKWNGRDLLFFKTLIYESCYTKKEIVKEDPFETGKRRILNFGHTVAHALEKIEEYQIPHGMAVALGILAEGFLSTKLNGIQESELQEIHLLLKNLGYPLKISEKVSAKKLVEAMKYDKKGKHKTPRFVILNGIGKVHSFKNEFCTAVEEEMLHESLSWFISEFSNI